MLKYNLSQLIIKALNIGEIFMEKKVTLVKDLRNKIYKVLGIKIFVLTCTKINRNNKKKKTIFK